MNVINKIYSYFTPGQEPPKTNEWQQSATDNYENDWSIQSKNG